MDIKKMWAFKVNDVDAVQSAGDLVDAHTQEASSRMQTAMDKAILDEGLKRLKEITESVFEYESIYNKLLKIYENLKNIYDELYLSNPKFNLLQSISDKNSIIILNNDSEIDFIQKGNISYKSIYKLKDLKYIRH